MLFTYYITKTGKRKIKNALFLFKKGISQNPVDLPLARHYVMKIKTIPDKECGMQIESSLVRDFLLEQTENSPWRFEVEKTTGETATRSFVVNASCEPEILVKLAAKSQVKILNVVGDEIRFLTLEAGWQMLPIPLAGMAAVDNVL